MYGVVSCSVFAHKTKISFFMRLVALRNGDLRLSLFCATTLVSPIAEGFRADPMTILEHFLPFSYPWPARGIKLKIIVDDQFRRPFASLGRVVVKPVQ